MAHGIQLLTSDGLKSTLDFKAGRYAGVSVETNVKEDRDVIPPAGIVLSEVLVWFTGMDVFFLAFSVTYDTVNNKILIRKFPNVTYGPGDTGPTLTFFYVRFQ